MKKRLSAALILLLLFCLCVHGTALAQEETGLAHVTDAAGLLTAEQLSALEELAARTGEEGRVELYIVTMEDYREYTTGDALACAGELYDYFGLGSESDHSGVLLLLSMKELDYALIVRGEYGNYCFGQENLSLAEAAFLNGCRGENWQGGMEDFLKLCGDVLRTAAARELSAQSGYQTAQGLNYPENSYVYGVEAAETAGTEETGGETPAATEEPTPAPTEEPQTTALREDGKLNHVTDSADILTASQEAELEKRAAAIGEKYPCEVYIVTVQDYRSYTNGDVNDCSTGLYSSYDLGYGSGRAGLLLLLSMNDRDYSIIHYGYYGEYCFGDHNLDLIEENFLDNFRVNDWEGGFEDYLSVSEDILHTAAAHGLGLDMEDQSFSGLSYPSHTYRYGVTGKLPVPMRLLIGLGAPSLVALIVCSTFKAQMKTAKERTTAEEYVVPGSATLHIREDRFINRTETRTRIHTESSSGGSGRSSFGGGGGGGFGGHSGKF